MTKEQKALAVIDALCTYYELEYYKVNPQACKIAQKVGRMAHCVLPTECKHPDWEKELKREFNAFLKAGMIKENP